MNGKRVKVIDAESKRELNNKMNSFKNDENVMVIDTQSSHDIDKNDKMIFYGVIIYKINCRED